LMPTAAPDRASGERIELTGAHRDGTVFPVEMAYSVAEPGLDMHITGIVRDLSLRRQMEQQLATASKFETLSQLSAGIAHDMNNTLAAVLSYLELLAEGDEPDLAHLDAVMGSTLQGASLMKRMMRASLGMPHAPIVVDINRTLVDMRPILVRGLTPTVELDVELSPEEPAVEVDRHAFEDAILNLCLNAGQAMPDGGRLVVRVTADAPVGGGPPTLAGSDRHVCLEICDTGVGMTPDTVRQIFDPFFTTRAEGTGLGLSMVHRFATSHRGAIAVESAPGEGTTMRLWLPRSDLTAGTESARSAAQPTTRARILLVEDVPSVAFALRRQLESAGHGCVVAEDATEALQHLETDRGFDVLLTDIILPNGMSGLDLIPAAREIASDIRVVAMTGSIGTLRQDLTPYRLDSEPLIKPFTRAQLAASIEEATGARAAA